VLALRQERHLFASFIKKLIQMLLLTGISIGVARLQLWMNRPALPGGTITGRKDWGSA